MTFDHLCTWLTERFNARQLPYGLDNVAFRAGSDFRMIVVGERGDAVVWQTLVEPQDEETYASSRDPIRWLVPANNAVFRLHHYLDA